MVEVRPNKRINLARQSAPRGKAEAARRSQVMRRPLGRRVPHGVVTLRFRDDRGTQNEGSRRGRSMLERTTGSHRAGLLTEDT